VSESDGAKDALNHDRYRYFADVSGLKSYVERGILALEPVGA